MKNNRIKFTREELQSIRSKVMTIAASLMKNNRYNRSRAVRVAWTMIRQLFHTKVVGVIFGKRQQALKNLLKYDPRRIHISIQHEADNPHDPNALAVIVTVIGKGSYKVGYVKKTYSAIFVSLLSKGHQLSANLKSITGGGEDYYGLNISFMIDPAACTRELNSVRRIANVQPLHEKYA